MQQVQTTTLIANSGIQFLKTEIEINPNDDVTKALRFYEWYDPRTFQVRMEYAVFLPNENVWVSKRSLKEEGYYDDNGKLSNNLNLNLLKIINKEKEGYSINNVDINIKGSLFKDKTALEHFENKWLPVPYFEIDAEGRSSFGTTNWARIKLIPKINKGRKGSHYYDVVIAFDTKAVYDEESIDIPVFYRNDRAKAYSMCKDVDLLLNYVTDADNRWIDEYLVRLVHGDSKAIPTEAASTKYKAYYIYLMHYLQMKEVFPEVKLFADRDTEKINVDLVLDIGNSRTCGLLFEDSDFTKVKMLELQDMTNVERYYNNPFDMRLAFRKADFGEMGPEYSKQFLWPSILRVGEEASWLIYHSKNTEDAGIEKVTNYSSPKRYLWDSEQFTKQWEFIQLENEVPNPMKSIYIQGISEQFNNDGSFNPSSDFGIKSSFSRQSLMTFVFLEILSQAQRQVNSHVFRETHGMITFPRKINRIIITCPTAMSKIEQVRLRKCAEEASIVLKRFLNDNFEQKYDSKTDIDKVDIVPSVKELSYTMEDIHDKKDWGYDEATSCQLVFLYAEISKRYLNKCKEYFDLYGKFRADLPNYDKKSLTIGSIDIGAGTTDLMICAYKYDEDAKAVLTPVPLFWESFYYAGDDLLKEIIHQVIVEGSIQKEEYRDSSGVIFNHLKDIGVKDINAKINTFFGQNTNQMSYHARKIRNDFNTQVSVPIALKFLAMTQKQCEDQYLIFEDFFITKRPNKDMLDYFANHFGFRFEELKWKFSLERMNEIIIRAFEPLLKKLSSLLYAYGCDFILLAGKPTSLNQIEEMFLKFYPVPPNRMITLNRYRVGKWYPFADGNGYFEDQKSLVAVGAMIGFLGDICDSLGNFKLNMEVMRRKFLPTSEHFGNYDRNTKNIQESYISPEVNNTSVPIAGFPVYIGTKQLDTISYPARALYIVDFDDKKIRSHLEKNKSISDPERLVAEVENFKLNIKRNMPAKIRIIRDYRTDKELLHIESVVDKNKDDLNPEYFKLRLQTLSDSENYWLDSGEFVLGIRQ
jgi:hypothetical protein